MIIFRNIGSAYETTSRVTGQEHLEGMIEVSVIPPDNLENPEFGSDEFYNLDLVMIESDKPYKLCGKRLQWDNSHVGALLETIIKRRHLLENRTVDSQNAEPK